MPSSYVVSLIVAVVAVVAVRLLLPVRPHRTRGGVGDAVLVLLGALGLVFHCGAMFYRGTVDAIPGTHGLVGAVNAMSAASMVAFAVPAALLLIGLRRARPTLLVLVIAALAAVGVTMYDGSSLHAHLTTIVIAAALIALTATDSVAGRGGRTRFTRSGVSTSG